MPETLITQLYESIEEYGLQEFVIVQENFGYKYTPEGLDRAYLKEGDRTEYVLFGKFPHSNEFVYEESLMDVNFVLTNSASLQTETGTGEIISLLNEELKRMEEVQLSKYTTAFTFAKHNL